MCDDRNGDTEKLKLCDPLCLRVLVVQNALYSKTIQGIKTKSVILFLIFSLKPLYGVRPKLIFANGFSNTI